MPEYTTGQAAEILKTDRRNVQNYAKRHNLPKFGREYIIKESDFEGMRSELGKPGKKPIDRSNVTNERDNTSSTGDRAQHNAE